MRAAIAGGRFRLTGTVTEPFVPDRGHDLRRDGFAPGHQRGEVFHLRVVFIPGCSVVHDAGQVVRVQALRNGAAQAGVLRGADLHERHSGSNRDTDA